MSVTLKPAVDAYLREARIAKLATLNRDGSPNIVPVWYEWDGAMARVFTTRGSPKTKRIARDPRVALSVEEGVGLPEKWVTIEGTVSIEDGDALALARRLIERHYSAERIAETWPTWEAEAANWVLLAITPTRIRTEGF